MKKHKARPAIRYIFAKCDSCKSADRPVTIRAGEFRFLIHADTNSQALDKILRSVSLAGDAKA